MLTATPGKIEEIRRGMTAELTEQQARLLRYICAFLCDRGYQPSVREICERFGFASPNGLRCHLKALHAKGFIEIRKSGDDRRIYRAIRLLKLPDGSPFRGLAFVKEGGAR